MKIKLPTECPECAAKVAASYERPYQEYPGASVQGGYHFCECEKCGWNDIFRDVRGYDVRENTRGW